MFQVLHYAMTQGGFQTQGEVWSGAVVSLVTDGSDVVLRPTRRTDDPGSILGLYDGGTVFTVGGEFALAELPVMGCTRPDGQSDVAVVQVAVGMPLTVSSQGDGLLVVAGAAGDPVVAHVMSWDGSTLRFRWCGGEGGRRSDDLPTTSHVNFVSAAATIHGVRSGRSLEKPVWRPWVEGPLRFLDVEEEMPAAGVDSEV